MNEFSHVLVTGGAGFIGSHLARRLVTTGYNVTILDNLQSGRVRNIVKCMNTGRCKLIKGDIRDKRVVKDAMNGVDAVVHLAALIDVEESVINPLETHDVNVNGSLIVLNEAVRRVLKNFCSLRQLQFMGKEIHYRSERIIQRNLSHLMQQQKLQPRVIARHFMSATDSQQ